MSRLDQPYSLNPVYQESQKTEHITLDCPIFDQDGNEIGTGKVEVEYYRKGMRTYIVNVESPCHGDDVAVTLSNEFKNYERA